MRARAVMVAAISLGVTLAFSAGALRAAEGSSAEAIEKASTAPDHAAFAERYTKEADELHTQLDRYRHSCVCRRSRLFQKVQLRWTRSERCRERIDQYRRAAQEAEALAREHRELAKQSSQGRFDIS